MPEHANAVLIRRLHGAFASGDLDAITGSVTPDFTLHALGRNPLAGDYAGREGLLYFLGKSVVLVGDTLEIVLGGVLADDSVGVAFEHVTARREGRSLDAENVTTYRFADGKITEMTLLSMDPYAHDAFWS